MRKIYTATWTWEVLLAPGKTATRQHIEDGIEAETTQEAIQMAYERDSAPKVDTACVTFTITSTFDLEPFDPSLN